MAGVCIFRRSYLGASDWFLFADRYVRDDFCPLSPRAIATRPLQALLFPSSTPLLMPGLYRAVPAESTFIGLKPPLSRYLGHRLPSPQ
jgi:hypothetical protein